MAKPQHIELGDGTVISILYEDRAVMAIDKPAGWLLAPDSWDNTGRNLQLALLSSIQAGDFWARSRNLKYLRFIHRLDADTSGVLLLAKSQGALKTYSQLFENRRVEKIYLAVVRGIPQQSKWTCDLKLSPHPQAPGVMKVDARNGKDAETHFRVLQTVRENSLIEVRPMTGRTHQIRVHLATAGHPVLRDPIYGLELAKNLKGQPSLALRAVRLEFPDPFQRRVVRVFAPFNDFVREHGFNWKGES